MTLNLCLYILIVSLSSCSSDEDSSSDNDYLKGTTVYFPNPTPNITLFLGDPGKGYDTTLDQTHKFLIRATYYGSNEDSYGSVQLAIDNSLCDNLYFDEEHSKPIKVMPSNYYSISSLNLSFNGSKYGTTEVQLLDAFFKDPESVRESYAIPLVMVDQKGFENIYRGETYDGSIQPRQSYDQFTWNEFSIWKVPPRDYVIYCVSYMNKYSGIWKVKDQNIFLSLETLSLNSCSCSVSFFDKNTIYETDLLLDFKNDDTCVITSLTEGVIASGSGKWSSKSEIINDEMVRDGLSLQYKVDFGNGKVFTTKENLEWFHMDGGDTAVTFYYDGSRN